MMRKMSQFSERWNKIKWNEIKFTVLFGGEKKKTSRAERDIARTTQSIHTGLQRAFGHHTGTIVKGAQRIVYE